MRKLTLTFVFLSCISAAMAQQAAAVDSMKSAIANSKTVADKVYWLDALSRTLMNVSTDESEKYGKELIAVAEESRDRRLMIQAYSSNGTRCTYLIGVRDYGPRSIEFFNKALEIARHDKLDDEVGQTLLSLATAYRMMNDNEKALSLTDQAFSIISSLHLDSLLSRAHGVYGDVYLAKNDKILSLRHYLNALQTAEDVKYSNESKKAEALRSCYVDLSAFYVEISDFDKAIDYTMLATKELDHIKEKFTPYQRVIDTNNLGKLFGEKKNYELAIGYFERSLAMADSLKFSNMKIPAYVSILNQYLKLDQPQKALDYFNSSAGMSLREYLSSFGMGGVVDQSYGYIYTQLGNLDSAGYHFARAEPFYENGNNELAKLNFYAQRGSYYTKTGECEKAIALYLKVKDIADRRGLLESAQGAAKHLDSLYTKTGDFKQSGFYRAIFYQYKDSIQGLNKEKELTQVEIQDEQLRKAKLEREELEAKHKRYNIQYLAITIGIASLVIIMVMMGMFKVSATTIKMIGFFTFLMLFEFVFLIFKKNIASFTHGEPWKDLSFMIVLAAILLPLHHWLEHRVIHYLTSHNRLTASGQGIVNRLFGKRKSTTH